MTVEERGGKMVFWIFMLICVLLLPLAMIVEGIVYFKGGGHEKINDTFGYRTKLSMRNQDTWDFAQKNFGKMFLITGVIILLPSAIPMLFVIGSDVDVCGWTGGGVALVQILVMLSLIPIMESAIKKKFPQLENKKD